MSAPSAFISSELSRSLTCRPISRSNSAVRGAARRHQHRLPDRQHIGPALFRHVHQPHARECRRVHPRTMHQHRIADIAARRFQMQAALHHHRLHAIAERLHLRRQLSDPRRVAPRRHSHVKRLPRQHHVAAVQRRRFAHPAQRPVGRQRARQPIPLPRAAMPRPAASSPRSRPARSPGPPRTPRPDSPPRPAARSLRTPVRAGTLRMPRAAPRARAISIFCRSRYVSSHASIDGLTARVIAVSISLAFYARPGAYFP